MMHLARQLIGALAMPLVLALLLVVAAAFYWVWRRRLAGWLLASAAALVYVSALPVVGDSLLYTLEERFPLLDIHKRMPIAKFVVVLGSGYRPRDGISAVAALDEDGLVRIVEAVRIGRALGTAQLIVSGGALPGQTPSAQGYAELARELGVDSESIVILDKSIDTAAEARAVESVLGGTPFVLVTSAYHMARAMRLMERAGARPIPAPAGQRARPFSTHGWRDLLPTSGGLSNTERALHEYLGLASVGLGTG
jgi:uncharacterized SAM-binding protein YcdF (DUF218 family)